MAALRFLGVLLMVGLVLAFPWRANGVASYPADVGALESVAPANSTAISFDRANHAIDLGSPANGTARVDLLHTRYPFGLSGQLAVTRQAGPLPDDWHLVNATAALPAGAAYVILRLGAANGTWTDFASVRVTGAQPPYSPLFAANFSASTAGWNLTGPATFGTYGSPSMRAVQVTGNGSVVGEASTVARIPIPPQVRAVNVSGLLRFNGTPGPFKIVLDVLNASLDRIAYADDWGAWASYESTPVPLEVVFWSSALPAAIALAFLPLSEGWGTVRLDLEHAGQVRLTQPLGRYAVGVPAPFSLQWTPGVAVNLTLGLPNGTRSAWSSVPYEGIAGIGALVDYAEVTVSASVAAASGYSSAAIIGEPTYTFSGSGAYTALAGNVEPAVVCTIVTGAALGLLAPEWWPAARRAAVGIRRARAVRPFRWLERLVRHHGLALGGLAGAAALYAALAASYGGHPYDAWVFKVWAYSGQTGGIRGIYVRPEFVGDAIVRGGDVPWGTTGFAYGPLCAPLFAAIARLVPPLTGYSSVSTLNGASGVGWEITWLLALFTVAAGGVLYVAVLRATERTGPALAALLLLVLNPAVVFDSAVWGETDSVLYLLIVLFAALAVYRPVLAMAVAGAAIAFKETGPILLLPAAMLILAPAIEATERLRRLAAGAVAVLVSVLPVVWSGVLPSVLLSSYGGIFSNSIAGGASIQPSVSPETYTVWTLFTSLTGAHGIDRMLVSSSTPLVAGLSFAAAAALALAASWLLLLWGTRRWGRRNSLFLWLAATAFAAVTVTALLTGTGSRYYTLAIPGLAGVVVLANEIRGWTMRPFSIAAYGIPTAISFWTMLGVFAVIMDRDYPTIAGLGLSYNPWTRFALAWYPNDAVVTAGSLGAVVLILLVGHLFVRAASAAPPTLGPRRPTPPTEPTPEVSGEDPVRPDRDGATDAGTRRSAPLNAVALRRRHDPGGS